MDELYKRYRPTDMNSLVGQAAAVKSVETMVANKKIPHTILLTGPSGCGKTTIARILKNTLKVADPDFREINAADNRGIELVRDIRSVMNLSAMRAGGSRCWLIDEAHALTKDAQGAFLKILEDTPKHVYFMLATTDPNKLLKTIQTRCTEIRVKALAVSEVKALLNKIVKQEKAKVSEEVIDRIAEVADGSARKALVLLGQCIDIKDEDEQLEAILASDSKRQAIEVAKLLMNPRTKWPDVAKVLKEVEDEPEMIRRLVLAYARGVLLGGGGLSGRAFLVINAFRDFFGDANAGHAVLAASCWEVVTTKG